MGGGSGSSEQTVGYRYFLGFHSVLCHGPIDKIVEVRVDDRLAFLGSQSESGTIVISKPGLFGGEDREGGVEGNIDIAMGEITQVQNPYLQAKIDVDIPAYRGVVSAIFNQMYIGINPYLKPWAFRAQRIHTTTDGDVQWLDSKAQIGVPPDVPLALYIAIDFSGSMNEVTGNGNTRYENARISIVAVLEYIKILIQDNLLTDVDLALVLWGWVDGTTRQTLVQRQLTPNDIDTAIAWLPAGPATATGTIFKTGVLDANTFYDVTTTSHNRFMFFLTDGEPSPGNPGTVAQDARDIIDTISDLSVFGINIDLSDTQYTEIVDNTPDDGVPVVDGSDPGQLEGIIRVLLEVGQLDMNPIHIIRECLTDNQWGMGYLPNDIDDVSFTDAAGTLFTEGLGISMIWDQQNTIEDFITDILRHIDGSLYVDRKTGKFTVKLVRDDFDIGTLPILSESNIKKVSKYNRTNPADIVNSVTIVYRDEDGNKAAVTSDDIALIHTMGTVISTTLQYEGFSRKSVAEKIVARDLRALSSSLLNVVIEVNRESANLNIGEPFKLVWPDYHEGFIVMRVQQITIGDGNKNIIKISATEDIFITPESLFIISESDPGTSIGGPPEDVVVRIAIEAPYYEVIQLETQLTTDQRLADNNDLGYVLAAAAAPNNGLNAGLWTDAGGGYRRQTLMDFSPAASLSVAVRPDDITFNVGIAVNPSAVTIGSHAQIGNELVKVVAIDSILATVTVGRGVLDTVPEFHASGAIILFWDVYADGDKTEYVASESINVKLLTNSSEGTLDINSATAETVVMASRAIRPYAPGNVKFNGLYFPDGVLFSDDTVVTWAHRDRIQQTANDIFVFTDGNIGPEVGTTYELDFYGETGSLLHSVTGLTGLTYTYSNAQEIIDSAISHPDGDRVNGSLRIVLRSRRDGYASFQEHDYVIQRYGWGFNYGKFYGGV